MIPRTLRGWLTLATILLLAVVIGAALGGTILALSERDEPAMHLLAQSDAGQVALNDGRIQVFTKVERRRRCKVEISYWLMTLVRIEGEDERLYVPVSDHGAVPNAGPGVASYVLSEALPAGLWPSEWYWVERHDDYCGLLGSWFPVTSVSEPLRLDIDRLRAIPNVPVTAERDGKTIVRSRSPALPPVPGAKP